MNIVDDWPPNIETIRAALDISKVQPIFTYGDTIYNPYKIRIGADLIAHEETHERQQAAMGVEAWWTRYLADPDFRASQEIAAYRNHLRVLRKYVKDRNAIARVIFGWAKELSGAMYGGCVSHGDAMRKIRMGIA